MKKIEIELFEIEGILWFILGVLAHIAGFPFIFGFSVTIGLITFMAMFFGVLFNQ